MKEPNKDIFNFEEGDKIKSLFHDFIANPIAQGILLNIEPGEYGNNFILEYEGKQIIVGYRTALKDKLTRADIGKAIKIVYKGLKENKTGKREYMDFDIFVKEVKN
jgi:hypothetical protein